MKSFNVLWWDFNKSHPEYYDVIPRLVEWYKELKDKPKDFDSFKSFIKDEALYHWWSRCEYEIIVSNWPTQDKEKKIDIYDQVMANIDLITELLMQEVL